MKNFKEYVLEGRLTVAGITFDDVMNNKKEASRLTQTEARKTPILSAYKNGKKYYFNSETTLNLLYIPKISKYVVVMFKDFKTIIIRFWSADKEYEGTLSMPATTFFKKYNNIVTKPLTAYGKVLNKFSHFEIDSKNLFFVFKEQANEYVNFYYGTDDIKLKTEIDRKIESLTDLGIKIPKTEINKLKVMLPKLYGNIDFELSNKMIPKIVDFSNDKTYQRFMKNMDNESRTGWGIKITDEDIYVHGMVGNISSGYKGKRFNINNKISSAKGLKTFMEKEGVIDYIIALGNAIYGEMASYTAYMQNGGAID